MVPKQVFGFYSHGSGSDISTPNFRWVKIGNTVTEKKKKFTIINGLLMISSDFSIIKTSVKNIYKKKLNMKNRSEEG